MIVLDTHVWIWCLDKPDELSERAQSEIASADVLGVSAISCWEFSMLVARGRLGIGSDPLAWVTNALAVARVELLRITPQIAVRAGQLGRGIHGDPADRIIAATALEHGCNLVTADRLLRATVLVPTVW